MFELNNKEYRLVFVDTCIVSELLKQKKSDRSPLLNYLYDSSIPCFSAHNLKELKRFEILNESFSEMFKVLPSYFLKEHDQLLSEEIENYESGEKVVPVIAPLFNNPFLPEDTNLIDKANETMTDELMQQYNADMPKVLSGILELKENYKSKGKKYTIKEIDDFVWMASFEQVVQRHITWAMRFRDKGAEFDITRLPSLRFMTYVLFYKFYITNRKSQVSDVPDMIMSSAYPYLDAVILEKNQADITRQILRRHQNMPQIEVLTMKDF